MLDPAASGAEPRGTSCERRPHLGGADPGPGRAAGDAGVPPPVRRLALLFLSNIHQVLWPLGDNVDVGIALCRARSRRLWRRGHRLQCRLLVGRRAQRRGRGVQVGRGRRRRRGLGRWRAHQLCRPDGVTGDALQALSTSSKAPQELSKPQGGPSPGSPPFAQPVYKRSTRTERGALQGSLTHAVITVTAPVSAGKPQAQRTSAELKAIDGSARREWRITRGRD